VVAVVGVLALILVAVALAGGGDDEAGGDGPSTTSSMTEETTSDPTTGSSVAGGGYDNAALEAGFVQGCTGELTDEDSGVTEEQCPCAYPEIAATMPYEDFEAYSAEAAEAAPAEDVLTAMLGCRGDG
jgi:hypothetical protein